MVSTPKQVLIRVDASVVLGFGHLYRCVTLAEYLREMGAEVVFLSQPINGIPPQLLIDKNFKVYLLSHEENEEIHWEEDLAKSLSIIEAHNIQFDWIIVDHYYLDYRWEKAFREKGKKILVIDDLVNRKHDCNFYLNQTFNIQKKDCLSTVKADAKCLLGEKYILLRPEFKASKYEIMQRSDEIKNMHVFFGSTDLHDYNYQFSEILLEHFPYLNLKIINSDTQSEKWKKLKEKYPEQFETHTHVKNMAQTMIACDIAFGAPGMATWERASLGLPGIYVATHENQVEILSRLQQENFCYFLGMAKHIQETDFITNMKTILNDTQKLFDMGQLGFERIDAKGGERVATLLMEA